MLLARPRLTGCDCRAVDGNSEANHSVGALQNTYNSEAWTSSTKASGPWQWYIPLILLILHVFYPLIDWGRNVKAMEEL
jgi:hypothetical protein